MPPSALPVAVHSRKGLGRTGPPLMINGDSLAVNCDLPHVNDAKKDVSNNVLATVGGLYEECEG